MPKSKSNLIDKNLEKEILIEDGNNNEFIAEENSFSYRHLIFISIVILGGLTVGVLMAFIFPVVLARYRSSNTSNGFTLAHSLDGGANVENYPVLSTRQQSSAPLQQPYPTSMPPASTFFPYPNPSGSWSPTPSSSPSPGEFLPSPSPSSTPAANSPNGIMIGGISGGVVALVLGLGLVLKWRYHSDQPPAPSDSNPPEEDLTEGSALLMESNRANGGESSCLSLSRFWKCVRSDNSPPWDPISGIDADPPSINLSK